MAIVLLGIFGVISFALVRRTKEIAIRRVLGAHPIKIVLLFVRDYIPLIVLANGIGWPCAYLICDKWLENYSYRIEQDFVPYLFVLTFISICTFALIGLQSIKVATENPVKNLRSE